MVSRHAIAHCKAACAQKRREAEMCAAAFTWQGAEPLSEEEMNALRVLAEEATGAR